jgi:hypothetical protein
MVLRLLGAFVLVQAFVMAFQGLAFMRTDGYMVLSTAVGGRNLHRVSALWLRRAVGLRRTAHEKAELAGAHPADTRHARWYRLLYLLGIGWVLWFLVAYVWPSLRLIVDWTLITAQRGSPAQALWWEAALRSWSRRCSSWSGGLVRSGPTPEASMIRVRMRNALAGAAAVGLTVLAMAVLGLVPFVHLASGAASQPWPCAEVPGVPVPYEGARHVAYDGEPHEPYGTVPPTSGPHSSRILSPGGFYFWALPEGPSRGARRGPKGRPSGSSATISPSRTARRPCNRSPSSG